MVDFGFAGDVKDLFSEECIMLDRTIIRKDWRQIEVGRSGSIFETPEDLIRISDFFGGKQKQDQNSCFMGTRENPLVAISYSPKHVSFQLKDGHTDLFVTGMFFSEQDLADSKTIEPAQVRAVKFFTNKEFNTVDGVQMFSASKELLLESGSCVGFR